MLTSAMSEDVLHMTRIDALRGNSAFGKSSVLVVGGDHYNTLATVRCLGRERIPFALLLHGSETYASSRIAKSSFAPSSGEAVGDSEEGLRAAVEKWAAERPGDTLVAYTCSDLAERVVEECLPSSVHPRFAKGPTSVLRLMDKHAQANWAQGLGIEVALDDSIDLDETADPDNLFRRFGKCIFKPVESALGSKSDIRIAATSEEVARCLSFFRANGYRRILIQQFVDFEYELNANGCVLRGGEVLWHVIKKVQIHPTKGGSLAYGVLEKDPSICMQVKTFIQKLADEGYWGIFDIEFFVLDGKVSLNECNFRQSGLAFSLINRGVPFPAIWIKDALGLPYSLGLYPKLSQNDDERFANERFLVASAVKREEKVPMVAKRLFGATQYGYWAKDDIPGSFAWYR